MSKELITKHVISVILLVAIAGYGGYYLGSAKTGAGGAGFQRGQMPGGQGAGGQRQGQGQNGQRGAMRGGNFLSGEVLKMDDKSVTIKLNDGGSKTAYFTASTSVDKSAVGAVSDLKTGDRVMVSGKANTDGSVNADTIQIRPAGMMPVGPGQGGRQNGQAPDAKQ